MKGLIRLCALCLALTLALSGASLAEQTQDSSASIVSYDYAAMMDWSPSYRLTMPGVLLELTHTEGLLAVSVMENGDFSPMEHLSGQLDRAGETLSVSDASIALWSDPFHGDGRCLSYTYTYPGGDEYHIARIWAAVYGDGLLVELSVDTWGADAEALMDAAMTAFIESGFTLHHLKETTEIVATVSDVREDENGLHELQLTPPGVAFTSDASFYPLAPEAVILFPNPDDPTLFLPIAPNAASLIDAVLTYEENSDSPATFRTVFHDGQIVYMEYIPQL